MSFRFTALGALLFVAGCASNPPTRPAAKPRAARAAPTVAAAHPAPPPVEDEQADDATAPATEAATPAAPAGPATPGTIKVASTEPQRPTRADPFGDVGFREVNEKDWLSGVRRTIAQREGIAPGDVRFSPGFLRATFVRSSPVVTPPQPGHRVPPRHHEIVVVDNQGRQVASFRPVTARGSEEPPADLRFLSEERLVYEVIAKPPEAKTNGHETGRAAAKTRSTKSTRAKAKAKPKPLAAAPHAPPAPPAGPPRLFVIQPLEPSARPIRCEGFHFTFTREHDRLAFMGGREGTSYVAVDGARVYPRRGRTMVAGAPVWSKDGRSLAFLETPPSHPARLVLLAALDNPAGDVTWDLPADANLEGAAVAWTSAGKLVVRKAATRPIFTASVDTDR